MRSAILVAMLLAAPAFADMPLPVHYTGAACFTDHVQVSVGGTTFLQCHNSLNEAISAHTTGSVAVAQVRFCAANGSGPLMPACANYEVFDQPGTGGDGVVTVGEILGISGFDPSVLQATTTNPVTVIEILSAHRSLRERYRLDEFERDLQRVLSGARGKP